MKGRHISHSNWRTVPHSEGMRVAVVIIIIMITVISVVLSGSPADISGRFTVLDGRREVEGDFRLTPGQ